MPVTINAKRTEATLLNQHKRFSVDLSPFLCSFQFIHSICYVSHFIIFRKSLWFRSEQGFPIPTISRTFLSIHDNLLSRWNCGRFIIEHQSMLSSICDFCCAYMCAERRAGKYLFSRVLFGIFSLFFALPKRPLRATKQKTQNTISRYGVETICEIAEPKRDNWYTVSMLWVQHWYCAVYRSRIHVYMADGGMRSPSTHDKYFGICNVHCADFWLTRRHTCSYQTTPMNWTCTQTINTFYE